MDINEKREARRTAVRAAFPLTIPVMTGFLCLGIAYGVLMQTKGYGVVWSTLMSAIAFCGSMQFVAITLLTTAFDPVAAFLLSLMVNARYVFQGLSMLERYRGLGRVRPLLIFTLCDETFSLSSSVDIPAGVERKPFYCTLSFCNYFYWVIGTALGGLVGNLITFNTAGLDFALTALMVVLLLEQWKKRENHPAAVIGLACTALSLVLFGAENLVLPAMGLVLVTLLIGRKRLCI
ncbi:MAG: AzlC family ABC transporter permease [Oscillospiraceae bacterium]